jgi:DNA-binding CsgD family transcriptional regulator
MSISATDVRELRPQEEPRSILVRLGRLGEEVQRLAIAVAVLGSDAEIRHVAPLCDLSVQESFAIWDLLSRAEILEPAQPLRFSDPIDRSVVYRHVPLGERTSAHKRAAEILAADGAQPDCVAMHCCACEPAGDAQLVQWLRNAADQALASGAPDAATRYLERALREPPAVDLRPQLHFELGRILTRTDVTRAAASLARAASTATDRALAVRSHRWWAYTLAHAGLMADAVAAFDRAIELAEDPDSILLITSSRDMFAAWWAEDPDRSERRHGVQERARAIGLETPGQRRALAAEATNICLTGSAPAADALELVQRIGSIADSEEEDDTTRALGTIAILCDHESRPIDQWISPSLTAEDQVLRSAIMRSAAALVGYRRGALFDAEAEARAGCDLFAQAQDAPTTVYWRTLGSLVQVLIARGLLAEAAALVEATGFDQAGLDVVVFPWPRVLRGELALARGDIEAGIALLLSAGAWLEERGFTNPGLIPWRALVAPALAARGRFAEAGELIGVAVTRARRFGAPWALGMSLRAAGTVDQGPSGIDLLRESVSVLDRSPCRVEHAHALLELGAKLRRANRRAEARHHLRVALDMSYRCGAVPLTMRAEGELRATGARPRRAVLSGLDSLTASERRIAELAASGLSNPEIAQQLFIGRKTVETHLGHVYLKLGIGSRQQLAGSLRADPARADASAATGIRALAPVASGSVAAPLPRPPARSAT